MKCNRNPNFKRRQQIDFTRRVMQLNACHLCRLLYVLRDEGFYRSRVKQFLDRYCESVRWVDGDKDTEIRRHRFDELLRDAPYITYSRAVNLLDCQAGFAEHEDEPLYREPSIRSDLIDNIVLALLTLHYDFGFGEKRISRIMTAWAHCAKNDAIKWAEELTGERIGGAPRSEIGKWIDQTKPKQRITLAEQKTAKAGLEALRKYQQEVRHEES